MLNLVFSAMETVADIMKMDREKQSRPINTAEVFAERSLRYTVAGHLLLAQSSYTVAGHLLLAQSSYTVAGHLLLSLPRTFAPCNFCWFAVVKVENLR